CRGTDHAVVRQEAVRVRQPGVRGGVLRVLDEGLFEEVERLPQTFFGALIQVIASLQIQVMGRQVFVGSTGRRAAVTVAQFRLDALHYRLRHALLSREDVAYRRVD